jgi:broad specificity phosphatase PhoE
VIYVTKVYVVRHCETDGNALKIFQGHTDNDINQMGAKQLVALGEKFKRLGGVSVRNTAEPFAFIFSGSCP